MRIKGSKQMLASPTTHKEDYKAQHIPVIIWTCALGEMTHVIFCTVSIILFGY